MTRRVIAFVISAVLCGAASACGNDSADVNAEEGKHFVTEFLRGRVAGISSTAEWYRTLDETLPTVSYIRSDGKTETVTDLVAVGSIVEVNRGKAFVVRADGEGDGIPADFDTKTNARWWTIHATVEVERAIGTSEPPKRVRLALPLGAPEDFDQMTVGLKALGRVVLFLDKGSPLVQYDPTLYVAIEQSALIATVANDGTLSLPMLEEEKAARLIGSTPRLSDLEARARTPRAIPLKPGTGMGNHVRPDGT